MSDRDPNQHETTADDERFLDQLRLADPVDPATLPSATGPEAVRLLDQVLAPEHDQALASEPADRAATPTVVTSLPGSGAAARRRSGLLGRGRGAMVAAAAAVAVVAGAVTVLSPDNTPAAVAEVRAAAATAADADTGRITSTFEIDYADEELTDEAGGQVEVLYDGRDVALSVELDDIPDELGTEADDLVPLLDDIRLVDDIAYIQEAEGEWIAIDNGGLIGDVVERLIDPRTVLDTVQTLTEATEVGPADVDGVVTTQYRSVVDLGDETLAGAGWLAFDGMGVDVDGEVTVDLYVEADGDEAVLRRLDLSGDLQAPEGETGEASFEIVTTFTGLDSDITIEAPADVEVIDPLDQILGGGDDGEDGNTEDTDE